MSVWDWAQLGLFAGLLILLSPLFGSYIAKVFSGEGTALQRYFGWLETVFYRAGGVDPRKEMTWIEYGKALFWINCFGFLAVLGLQLCQQFLPLNPQGFPRVSWDLAFNTAASFVTNTNWQAYSGENSLSYLTQMLGLSVQNFLSAVTGMATALALTRGIVRKQISTVGNFWADLIRSLVYVFLPLCLIMAVFLIGEGVVQTFNPYFEVATLENGKQTIPLGPAASQIAIKQLGTNGGGFFGANSAHPFENPTALSNFFEMFAIVFIPAALVHAYGIMVGSKKHGWLLFGVMFVFWGVGLLVAVWASCLPVPSLGGEKLLEGLETRFGLGPSILWTISTTATANGSVNAMISSLSPLAGGVAMFNIMLGELIFGGIGVGLCSMLMFVLLTVFLSGLMVGRTPEYFGKKIEKLETQWLLVAVLVPALLILIGTGLSVELPLDNHSPHGFSEILYAFTSCSGNNGSAFAGLNANTMYYNIFLGVVMLLARMAIIVPSLAIAGLLARKKITPPSSGTFSTEGGLFFVLLVSVILIVGILGFFPALSLGPIVEHMIMSRT